MPLSKPQPRQHIHQRAILCLGYQRDDGLWDIEATLTDTKSYSFDNHDRGGINAGEPIHNMAIRVTLDDQMLIHKAEAAIVDAPFSLCPAITPQIGQLKGLTIGQGWRRDVIRLFGKSKGCTHLTDLLVGPLATTAHQTVAPARARRHGQTTMTATEKGQKTKPAMLDTCHALKCDGPVVARHWPDFVEKL